MEMSLPDVYFMQKCSELFSRNVTNFYFGSLTCLISVGPRQTNLLLIPMRAAKVQASLRIRAVSPEPLLLAHTSSESRGTFRQKARSLAPLNGWACAVEICHDRMLEDTNSLGAAQLMLLLLLSVHYSVYELERVYSVYGNILCVSYLVFGNF